MKNRAESKRENKEVFTERKTSEDEQKEIVRSEEERIRAKMKLINKKKN